jgi:predicted phosphodiesterase
LAELKKILFVPDVHVPYHDKTAWGTMLAAMREWKPDIVVVLGDLCDMYSVSAHDKDPRRMNRLDWELEACNEALDQLDALGAQKKYFVEGNHETRWDRALASRATEFSAVFRLRDQLRLRERGWLFTPYKHTLRLGKLHITHDLGKSGRNAHRDAEATYQGCAVIGHTHALELSVVSNRKGKAHVAAMFGWLGDNAKIDYRHFDKAAREWPHGFGTGRMEPNGVVHISAHPIFDAKVCVEGHLYGRGAKR